MDDVQAQSDSEALPSTGVQTEPVDHIVCEKCHVEIDLTDLESFTKIACPNCGQQTTVPARLGSFLLLELLGMGGMGGVYIAKDETLGRLVAIKVMLESLGDDEEFITSFRNEAQAIAKLNHPNITQIYSFGQERGQPYIVMELVRGTRLDDMVEKATEPLDQGRMMLMALEVSEGLGAADDAGIIHGDVKPENILFDEKDNAKLVDFGLASSAHGSNQDNAIWGTPYYIAPEKVLRRKPDGRSDIYSLGATLYHILTGHPPFEGDNPIEVVKARLDTPPPPMKEYREDIDEHVERVIMRCLEIEPSRRYPNYKSLISDLRKVVEEMGVTHATNTKKVIKNIRIAKKRTTGRTTAPTPAVTGDTPPASSTGKGKRLVIKKRSGSSLKLTPKAAGADAPPRRPEPTPEELAAKAKRQRKAQQKGLITSLVIIFVIASAGIGAFLFMQAQEKAETRRIWLEVKTLRTTATNTTLAATVIVEHLATWRKESAPLAAQSQQAALAITGNTLALPKPAMPEPEPLPAAADTNATATASNSIPDAASVPAPAPAPIAATNAVVEAEMIEAPAEPLPPAAPPEPIEEAALACMMADAELGSLLQLASSTLTEMREASASVHQSGLPEEGATFVATIEAGMLDITAFEKEGHSHIKACRSQHTTTLDIKRRKDAETARVAARLAAEEAEARRNADAQRKASEQARLAEMEQGTVASLAEQMIVHMHSRNFQQAVRDLKPQLEAIQTEPGREAMQALIDRYRAAAAMRATLEELITKNPVRWGIGSGDTARDAIKADGRGVYISGQIKPIPWVELKTSDLLKLIDHFVVRTKTTRASQKVRLAVGAALFCDSFGEPGKAKAADYVRRAIILGMREEDITRLLPAYP